MLPVPVYVGVLALCAALVIYLVLRLRRPPGGTAAPPDAGKAAAKPEAARTALRRTASSAPPPPPPRRDSLPRTPAAGRDSKPPATPKRDSKPTAATARDSRAPVPAAAPPPSARPPPPEAPAESTARAAAAAASAEAAKAEHARRVDAVRKGLGATRGGLIVRLSRLFKGKKEISPGLAGNLEEVLITSDVGAKTAARLIERLKEKLTAKDLADEGRVWATLREVVRSALEVPTDLPPMTPGQPYVVLVLGVNGVGKTTTIGKLAAKYREDGLKVVLAAADTFRAAAVSQLQIWGRRVGCEVVCGKDGADPSSVAFDAVEKAKAAGAEIVVVDTAGRLHTKAPLMEELRKIARAVAKAGEGAPHEVLLTLDATTGQNAIQQATTFREMTQVTGIVLTKLDGTAKGGVILGICDELRLPVRYIGVGEGIEDLRPFDSDVFVAALFDDIEDANAAA